MDDLWIRNDRPIPATYWVTAAIGSLVVFVCFTTAWWVPGFAEQFASTFAPALPTFGSALMLGFGGSIGLVVAASPWLALRWPGLGLAVALLPLVPTALFGDALNFGVFAALCAVTLAAGWRDAKVSAVAAALAVVVVVLWTASEREMVAPFRSLIEQRTTGHEAQMVTLALYLLTVGAVVLGAWWLRLTCERELERQALAARSDQVEEQSAVVQERARLARDLHDVVAHHVSLIAVRAETAPYTHPDLGESARRVLADIAADARLALDELRGVLGILGRSGTADRAPQPTWSDITALVERTRSAGVAIEVVGDPSGEVSPSSGYAAYRVVQEALTNARKHAPGAPVTIDLDATSQLLTVHVSTPLGDPAPAGGGGQGLVGMRERVEALGGRLLSGPVGDHFVVEAILPRGVDRVPA
jgi:signal transduction histidine kinase